MHPPKTSQESAAGGRPRVAAGGTDNAWKRQTPGYSNKPATIQCWKRHTPNHSTNPRPFNGETTCPRQSNHTFGNTGQVRRRRTTDGSRGREPAVERSPKEPKPARSSRSNEPFDERPGGRHNQRQRNSDKSMARPICQPIDGMSGTPNFAQPIVIASCVRQTLMITR